MQIHQAGESDLDGIFELLTEMDGLDGRTRSRSVSREFLGAHLRDPDAPIGAFLAVHEGVIAGLAAYQRVAFTFGGSAGVMLDDLYVRPAFRSQGVGRGLVQALCGWTPRHVLERLDWNVEARNAAAVAFSRSLGAQLYEGWLVGRLTPDAMEALLGSTLRGQDQEPPKLAKF